MVDDACVRYCEIGSWRRQKPTEAREDLPRTDGAVTLTEHINDIAKVPEHTFLE